MPGIPFRVRGDRAFMDRPEVRSALDELRKNAAAAPGRDFAEHLTDLVVDATEASDDERAHREADRRARPRVPGRRHRAGHRRRVPRVPAHGAARAGRRRGRRRRGGAAHVPPGQGPRVGHRLRHRPRTRPRPHLPRAGRRRGPRRGASPALRRVEPRRTRSCTSRGRASATAAGQRRRRAPRAPTSSSSSGRSRGKEPEETGRVANQRGARAARERLAAAADAELTPDDRRVFDDARRVAARRVARRGRPRLRRLRQQGAAVGRAARARRAATSCSRLRASDRTKLERYGAAVLEIVGRHATSSTG